MNVTPGRGKSWYKLQWGSGSRWQEQPTGPGERNQRKGHGENLKEKAEKDRRKQGTGARRQETGFVMDLISSRAPAVTQLIAPHACDTIVNSSRSVMIWNSGVQDSGFNPLRGTALLMHECVWSQSLIHQSYGLFAVFRVTYAASPKSYRIACNEATVMVIILTPSLYYN